MAQLDHRRKLLLALTISGDTEYIDEDRQEDAMRRYWEARQSGDVSAKLIRIDQVPEPPEDDDPPPAAPGAVSATAVQRVAEQETWLTDAGFAIPPPLYAPGTRVVELGDRNFRLERQRVQDLPNFSEAATLVRDQIRAEDRRDVTVSLDGLTMTDRGTLLANGEEYWLETGSFHQLATLGGYAMGARYLAERCDPALRATNVNAQLQQAGNRGITLRTRLVGHRRSVFASVTPTYAAVDSDEVLETVGPTLSDARVEMRYDGSGIRATALFMPDQVVDLAAGDVFKVGVRVETDDTGRGRIRITGVVWRNLCLNLIIIHEGEVETVSLVHRGDPARIRALVADGVGEARASVGNFLDAWGHARTVQVDVEETLRSWVESKKLHVPGTRTAAQRDALVDDLLASWSSEPGDTLADAVNAVTRAAHENPLWGVDIREEIERQASRLVLVPR